MTKTWQKILVASLLMSLAAIFFHSELSLPDHETREAHHGHHNFCQLVNTTHLAKIAQGSRGLLPYLPVSHNLPDHTSARCYKFAQNVFSKNLFIENNSTLFLFATLLI
ncbi:MAG: hypothetical protein GXO75_16240 [Calditrichaeota bacterium]|nr:hypothetical protein [Calditrichota bacterium]